LKKDYLNQQSEAVRDVLQAYWDLWYTGRSIEIQKSALELATLQQQEADQKVRHGALSAADALKFQSQVATLTESYLSAQADERSQSLSLGQLVGIPTDSLDWHATNEEPVSTETLNQKELLRRALERNPAMESLKESLMLAVERKRTAGEQYRATLDLDAWAEAAGVGSGRVWPAVRQVGRLDAVSVYGGITYRTTLDSQQYSAARAQADYDVRIAESNIKIASQQIENSVAQLMLQVEQARVSAEAAERTLVIAEQQAKNERQRFALGASTPLDVQVAEDALRQAQLRVVRAKLDRKKTELSLAHMTGALVDQYLPHQQPLQ
jgi:outer membrane protein TolC